MFTPSVNPKELTHNKSMHCDPPQSSWSRTSERYLKEIRGHPVGFPVPTLAL